MAIFIPLVTKFDDKGLQGAKRALSNFQNFAVDVGRIAAAAVTAVGVASIKEFTQFETTFSRIQGLVGLTADEVAELEKAARELGPEFGKSGNEAADALFFITSAGLRGASAVDVLEASLKGSAIGLGSVSDIANAATAAMNTYGESNLSGTEAVDTLAEAVRLGQFAPEELAGALGRVIPISQELGVSCQETAGLIAGLTRGGLSASEAVTGIRGAMQAVLKPTGESAAMLEEYGFSAEGVRDSIEQDGLLATFGRLREAFGDNDEDFTRLIGSQEGLNAILALTGENSETYTGIVAEMTDGIGILDEAMALTSDTAQFKFDQAINTAKDSLITIGGELAERLLPYLDDFKVFMDENGPTIEKVFDTIFEAVEAVATKLGELGDAVLPTVIELMNNEQFQENVRKLGENLFLIAEEVIKFIESDFGQFLLDLTAQSIIGGLVLLNDQLERLSQLMFVLNEAFNILSGNAPSVDFETLMDKAGGAIGIRLSELADYFIQMQSAQQGYGGRRQGGGSVSSQRSYLVGEMGPELFVPSSGGGSIIPNDRVGGGAKINITVNAGMGANGAQIGEQIVSAIKRYERTSGPVFASA
jgi:TP901 family phage tail tape measure protein